MDRVYLFLIRNDVWIYIVSVLAFFWYLMEFVRAQATLRRAMFNLERETAIASRNHALSFLLFFAIVMGSVYYVNRYVAPNLPDELLFAATPTPNTFATPALPPTPITTPDPQGGPPFDPVLAPTVTLPAVPGSAATVDPNSGANGAVVETPEAPPTPFQECIPELTITEPLNGSVAFQEVVFRGTANTGELHQYVIELNGPQTVGAWAPISQEPVNQPVVESELGQTNLAEWESGPYLVRLRALDPNGRELGVCTIQIILDS